MLAILIGAIALACGSKQNSKEKEEAITLYKKSMAAHDEVMPRMDEMFRVEKSLKALRDSLMTDSIANAARLSEILAGIKTIKDAGKGMMDWMHHIQDVPGTEESKHGNHQKDNTAQTLTDVQVLKIQQDQKAAIDQVKAAMELSIEQGKALLNKRN